MLPHPTISYITMYKIHLSSGIRARRQSDCFRCSLVCFDQNETTRLQLTMNVAKVPATSLESSVGLIIGNPEWSKTSGASPRSSRDTNDSSGVCPKPMTTYRLPLRWIQLRKRSLHEESIICLNSFERDSSTLCSMNFTITQEYVSTNASRSRESGMAYHSILVLSDWHVGEVIDLPENKYNIGIAEKRVRQLTERFIDWQSGFKRPESVVLLILGDMISGDIHLEYQLTQTTSPQEQCVIVQDLLGEMINTLHKRYRVRIFAVTPDNHARLYKKPIFKAKGSYTYNLAILNALKQTVPKNVELEYSKDIYDFFRIGKQTFLCTHGDHIRAFGATPITALEKFKNGVYRKHAELQSPRPDYFVLGHFHVPAMYDNLIVNGSLSGTNEFGTSLNVCTEAAQVAFHCYDDGVRNLTTIKIQDRIKRKPRHKSCQGV